MTTHSKDVPGGPARAAASRAACIPEPEARLIDRAEHALEEERRRLLERGFPVCAACQHEALRRYVYFKCARRIRRHHPLMGKPRIAQMGIRWERCRVYSFQRR